MAHVTMLKKAIKDAMQLREASFDPKSLEYQVTIEEAAVLACADVDLGMDPATSYLVCGSPSQADMLSWLLSQRWNICNEYAHL